MSLEDNESFSVVYYYFKKKIETLLKDFTYVECLNDIICLIIKLKVLRFHDKLIERLEINRKNIVVKSLKLGVSLENKEIEKVKLIKLSSEYLNDPFFYPLFNKDLINFPDFYFLYKFMEATYFLDLGQFLEKEDIKNLYLSGLDENIIFKLDSFEEISENPEITSEFFFKLKQLKWENKKSKQFFKQLNLVRINTIYDFTELSDLDYSGNMSPSGFGTYSPTIQLSTFPPLHKRAYTLFGAPINRGAINFGIFFSVLPYGHPYFNFPATENAFLLFLAGCSAVNNNHEKINENDVTRAYKTYYKLLTTDISKLVNELCEERSKDNNGYLVCEKCKNYYKLQPGESPDDFTDKCECGGKLKYYDNINWLK
jgi:hypothetical protein